MATTHPASAHVPPTHDHTGKVKLPKISLPHLCDSLTKWTPFWDSFYSAVHTNDQLTDVDKFNYLKSLLEDVAHNAIAGLSLSSANYVEAIEILKKSFGNHQLIISKHMEVLELSLLRQIAIYES